MGMDTYMDLLSLVTPEILKKNIYMRRVITPHERLIATLRFLATGRSYRDLEFTTPVSKQSLSCIFPKTEKDWTDISNEFETKRQFSHCIGAIDGKYVRIVPPAG
ncbi:hypothetical protein ILUMI_20936, partial [Ignelater luminosus]